MGGSPRHRNRARPASYPAPLWLAAVAVLVDRLMDDAKILAWPSHAKLEMPDRHPVGDVERMPRRLPFAPEADVGVDPALAPAAIGRRRIEEPWLRQALDLLRPDQGEPEVGGRDLGQIRNENLGSRLACVVAVFLLHRKQRQLLA